MRPRRREEQPMTAGDHIRIMKPSGWQHAIDVGDRTVLHFAKGEGVKRSLLSQLATEGARVEVVTHPQPVFPPEEVVGRAFSRHGTTPHAWTFADSEAFAIWCKIGRVMPGAFVRTPLPPAGRQANGAAAQAKPARKAAAAKASPPKKAAAAKAAARPARAAAPKAGPKKATKAKKAAMAKKVVARAARPSGKKKAAVRAAQKASRKPAAPARKKPAAKRPAKRGRR
jgi:hypothetical protein